MLRGLDNLKREFPPMLRLAGPVVLSEIGWMTMGLVDTMMVGRVSAEAVGGVGIGGILFHTIAFFGAGVLLGLDPLVSQAFGAGKTEECHRWLASGVQLSLLLAAPLMGALWVVPPLLEALDVQAAVRHEALQYLPSIRWSTLPLLLFFALRRYLQAMNLVRPVLFALLSANLVNVAANWVLIFGHLGAPAMGAAGAGWATCASRIYMTLVLAVSAVWHDRRRNSGLRQIPLWPDGARILRLAGLGLPASLQLTVEIGVFAVATTLVGRLEKEWLAAHTIALLVASYTFMVPLGVSSATGVRVGQALGRKDAAGAARSGWTGMLLGAAFMGAAGVGLLAAPELVMRAFTNDRAVIGAGVTLLFLVALFQLFDGIQTVTVGALRASGDTRSPLLIHLVCYWLIGLPAGYLLCFRAGRGAAGLWAGLCIALILIGLLSLGVWIRTVRGFYRGETGSGS